MKFIDSVKQIEGVGGTLETWMLDNGLTLCYWKDKTFYSLFLQYTDELYTGCIFNLLNHPYNGIDMKYGGLMPPRIKMEHKYFDKFIQLVEKLSIDDLKADPFSG